mmetsp:Transcript_80876/g.142569  ORF Transcript_80876/g.142569 Transcript_80876/m.142569 type:complete len:225 (-) Transcript_80876:720-1394(-)
MGLLQGQRHIGLHGFHPRGQSLGCQLRRQRLHSTVLTQHSGQSPTLVDLGIRERDEQLGAQPLRRRHSLGHPVDERVRADLLRHTGHDQHVTRVPEVRDVAVGLSHDLEVTTLEAVPVLGLGPWGAYQRTLEGGDLHVLHHGRRAWLHLHHIGKPQRPAERSSLRVCDDLRSFRDPFQCWNMGMVIETLSQDHCIKARGDLLRCERELGQLALRPLKQPRGVRK